MKLLNIGKKFVTKFLNSLKFWCQVGDFGFDFQKFYRKMYFWKNMISNFSDKLGSWGMIHTGGHRPWSQKFEALILFVCLDFLKIVLF